MREILLLASLAVITLFIISTIYEYIERLVKIRKLKHIFINTLKNGDFIVSIVTEKLITQKHKLELTLGIQSKQTLFNERLTLRLNELLLARHLLTKLFNTDNVTNKRTGQHWLAQFDHLIDNELTTNYNKFNKLNKNAEKKAVKMTQQIRQNAKQP